MSPNFSSLTNPIFSYLSLISLASIFISNPAFSQSTRNGVCVSSVASPQPGAAQARIDDECQIQQIDNSTTLIQWSDGVQTRIEVIWNVDQPRSFEGTIDGTHVSGSGYNTPYELCLWFNSNDHLCYRYPEQNPPLSPGIYSLGSKYISIFSRNGRFCWMGSSIHGSTVQSLKVSSTDPDIYIPEFFGHFLYAIDSSTITWGGADYSFISEITNIPENVQRCLNSSQPFFESEAWKPKLR